MILSAPLLMVAAAVLVIAADLWQYDKDRPLSPQVSADCEVRDITFAVADGRRVPAFLVLPKTGPRRAGVLFVHWYEPGSADSNRTQFLPEAIELAKLGTVSLLPATMWSEPKWFPERDRARDVENSIAQVNDLRRALDLLCLEAGAGVPVAFVGHDFGAMFGAILAGVDRRPAAYALQAGTSTFSHWYLYGPKMEEPARSQFVEKLKAIDPVTHIGKAAPAPVLFQFGTKDPHVPKARAEEFIAAAKEPKKVQWYDAGHHLNDQARVDRVAWLMEQLGISPLKSASKPR